jgi:hypothetical protein
MKSLDESFRLVLPGERYNLDDQCRQIRGKESVSCTTAEPCRTLWCRVRVNSTQGEFILCQSTNAKVADGTTCNVNKVIIIILMIIFCYCFFV